MILTYILDYRFRGEDFFNLLSQVSTVVVALLIAMVAVLTYRRRGQLKVGSFTPDFEKSLGAEGAIARHRLTSDRASMDAAEKQYVLLSSYHAQSLAQSKQSFWFSLVFASLGFGVIVLAILGHSDGMFDKSIKLISGTVIDAVAGLFFVQSNKARELMSDFFDKLRTDRKLDESLRLVTEVPDPILKGRLQVVLSLNFADVKLNDSALQNLFDTQARTPTLDVTRTTTPETANIAPAIPETLKAVGR